MAHPMEAVLRDAYAAFGRGDLDGYLRPCAPDFEFCVPGGSALAGSYCGSEGLHELARKAMSLTGGSFHEDVEDVLANDRHAVVLARHHFVRNGQEKVYRTAHVYEIRDGKLLSCHEQPQDPAAFDDAWGPATAMAV